MKTPDRNSQQPNKDQVQRKNPDQVTQTEEQGSKRYEQQEVDPDTRPTDKQKTKEQELEEEGELQEDYD